MCQQYSTYFFGMYYTSLNGPKCNLVPIGLDCIGLYFLVLAVSASVGLEVKNCDVGWNGTLANSSALSDETRKSTGTQSADGQRGGGGVW